MLLEFPLPSRITGLGECFTGLPRFLSRWQPMHVQDVISMLMLHIKQHQRGWR